MPDYTPLHVSEIQDTLDIQDYHLLDNFDGIKSSLDDKAKIAGDQTLTGVKTFGTIPILPPTNPNTANQAVRKQYVDDKIGATINPYGMGGPSPYVDGAFRVRLPGGLWAVDTEQLFIMRVPTLLTVSINNSGPNGLDTGVETANATYFVWLIYNPTTQDTAGLLSLQPVTPTMPSGYTFKRLVFCVKNVGSAFVQGRCRHWQDGEFTFVPSVSHASAIAPAAFGTLVASGLAATTFTDLNCSNQIPSLSRFAELWIRPSAALSFAFRENGLSVPHEGYGLTCSGASDTKPLLVRLDAFQIVEYKVSTGSIDVEVFSWTASLRGD